MDRMLLDFYTDYLISSFGLTTATGLSSLLGNINSGGILVVCHDTFNLPIISALLNSNNATGRPTPLFPEATSRFSGSWLRVKPHKPSPKSPATRDTGLDRLPPATTPTAPR